MYCTHWRWSGRSCNKYIVPIGDGAAGRVTNIFYTLAMGSAHVRNILTIMLYHIAVALHIDVSDHAAFINQTRRRGISYAIIECELSYCCSIRPASCSGEFHVLTLAAGSDRTSYVQTCKPC